jgi:CMP-N-acetylneuraminic acid synthetase
MYGGKSVLVVVPARGGSKGVPLKNLHPLLGRPLLAHTGDLVRRLPFVDRAVVSTDHSGIAAAGRVCGLDAPFVRPPELSGDRIGDTEVLVHALQEMDRVDGRAYDVVVMLQPTCPLRRPEHVGQTVARLVDGGWEAVWTVSPTDLKYHPLKQLVVAADGSMTLFDPRGAAVVARQQLQPTYTRNGAAYALTRGCLLDQRTTLGRRASAVVIDEPMVSIDTLDDFALVGVELRDRAANEAG